MKNIYDSIFITENRSKDMNINPVGAYNSYTQKDTKTNSAQGSAEEASNASVSEEESNEPLSNSVIIEVKKLMQRKEDEYDQLQRDLIAARQSASSFGQGFQVKIKCLRIAGRITAGDKVSAQDRKYLAKHDPEMLAMAEMRKIEKEEPKKKPNITTKEDAEKESEIGGVSSSSDEQMSSSVAGDFQSLEETIKSELSMYSAIIAEA